jgi:four helix bundle protein
LDSAFWIFFGLGFIWPRLVSNFVLRISDLRLMGLSGSVGSLSIFGWLWNQRGYHANLKPMKESRTVQYDLEDRTFTFAKEVRVFAKQVPKTLANIEDAKQVVKASGSVGANYIEANESLSKKDFAMRIKICRKEAKESRYWLRLIDAGDDSTVKKYRDDLIQEATELTSIFGAILRKSE